jgi:hypothetical protein
VSCSASTGGARRVSQVPRGKAACPAIGVARANGFIGGRHSHCLATYGGLRHDLRGLAPIGFYRSSLVAVLSFVTAAACFIGAIILFTFCVPEATDSGTVCGFPHQLAAAFFAIAGIVFAAVGVGYGVSAWLSLEPDRYWRWKERWSPSDTPGSTQRVRP